MVSKELYKLLNRCIVDAEFCRKVLHQPEVAFKECDLTPAERRLVLEINAHTLPELAAGLQKAGGTS